MELRDAFLRDHAAQILEIGHVNISVIAAGSGFNMVVTTIPLCYRPGLTWP